MGKITDEMVASKTPDELRAIAVEMVAESMSADMAKGYAVGIKHTLSAFEKSGLIPSGHAVLLFCGFADSVPTVEAGALLLSLDGMQDASFAEMKTYVQKGLASRAGGRPQ